MRSRNVKPSLFKNEFLATSDPLHTVIFEGLWCMADREGRLEDRPRHIHLEINAGRAYEGTEASLVWLAEHGFIKRYEVGGVRYIHVVNFHKHQNPHQREQPSTYPPPPGIENRYNHEPVTEAQRQRIFERDGRACVRCGSRDDLQVDHDVPRSQGGTSEDKNLQILCGFCNQGKGSALPRHDLGTIRAEASPALSPSLIPDSPSLIPDSPSLIPDSPSLIPVEEPPADAVDRVKAMLDADETNFEDFKALYPQRNGNQPWVKARRAISARLAEGSSWNDILAGTSRYAEWCRATGKIDTETVMQAATFCGPEKGFLKPWKPPPTKADTRLAGNLSAADEFLRRTELQ